jgi:hypothetical protein
VTDDTDKYRNRKLLDIVRESPYCWGCGNINDGTVVPAHSNSLADGKGKGTKAHDFRIAALCFGCHSAVDTGVDPRTQARLGVDEKRDLWETAHRHTIGWLFLSGHLKVV